MEKICRECKLNFILEEVDLSFYKKIGVCIPEICPKCRAKIRLNFRNEKNLYHNKCDLTGENVISIFSPSKKFKIYSYKTWFSDKWDATEYQMEYNPDKPFFEQLKELFWKVPKPALIYTNSVNSDYTNLAADNKNSYMVFESSNNENATNCYWIQKCKDIADVSFSDSCELCINSDDCFNCYSVTDSKSAHNCNNCDFINNSRGLSNCIGCVNLYQGEYYILNKKYTKEEYEKEKDKLKLNSYSGRENFRKVFTDFLNTQPQKYSEITNSLNSTGNYLKNTKNCTYTFHAYDAEECRYAEHVWRNAKECVDVSTAGRNAQLIFNSLNSGLDTFSQIASSICWSSTYAYYSQYCFNCDNVFGCFGLRKKKYCILNKQYTEEQYNKIKDQIINELKRNDKFGEWFPKDMSFFGYNESVAQDQFPLNKESALNQGFYWDDSERGTYNKETKTWNGLDILNDQNILNEIFACSLTGKNFRFTEQEINLYKRLNYPLPRNHPDLRLENRIKERGENTLYIRKTVDGKEVLTPFPESDIRDILSDEEYKKRFM
jgi:hypothetical protein